MASRIRPVINTVGKQVLRFRTARDWSQEQLAARCQRAGWDVSRDIIARIEAGIRAVNDHDLAYLAQVFDVPLRDLYPAALRASSVDAPPSACSSRPKTSRDSRPRKSPTPSANSTPAKP
jgi:transcriptional regulator with XRE-family HTH domain